MAFFIPSYINTMVNIYLRITVKQTFYDNIINILRIRYTLYLSSEYLWITKDFLYTILYKYHGEYLFKNYSKANFLR